MAWSSAPSRGRSPPQSFGSCSTIRTVGRERDVPRYATRRIPMITQADIDRLKWFHDFDFPGGLKARSAESEFVVFRRILQWFVSEQLRTIDLAGKTVVDVGCWDGFFSFLAEERGARRVLAVDDASQNWGSTECFRLARELKQSRASLMPDVSVYRLSEVIQEQFDAILFL